MRQLNPEDYSSAEELGEMYEQCLAAAEAGDLAAIEPLLLNKAQRPPEKELIPRIAAAAMITAGPSGASSLARLAGAAPGFILPLAVLRALWCAGSGQPLLMSFGRFDPAEPEVSDETRKAALEAFDDLVIEAQRDDHLGSALLGLQQQEALTASGDRTATLSARHRVMSVIRESAIILTSRLLDEFDALISADLPEATYQAFLEQNPVFLDPLAAEVFNRHRLGTELVTDFVIRRHDSRYVVVEIEKPQDPIFTAQNNFTSDFTHASGQVLDFQGWISSNVSYARTHLPLIENPSGLLIMGRRSSLSEPQLDKLRRWSENSRHIEVLTFDDLSVRARALHASLRGLATQ